MQSMPGQRAEIIPGSVWRQVTLGSEAIYEVVAVDGDHVDVSVNRAPGLTPGMRVRLTVQAVRAMVRVDDDGGGLLARSDRCTPRIG
jgi:hypothetical protein